METTDDATKMDAENQALRAENARLKIQLDALQPIAPRPRPSGQFSTPGNRDVLFSAVEATTMPMILTDPNQPNEPIIFANRAFQELSGYSADELLGRNCRFLQGAETDPAQVQRIRDALKDNQDVTVELLNVRRDGTQFLNQLYISPVLGPDGRLLYHFGSQVDVTARHEDRRRLEAREQRHRAIFDSIIDVAIIVTDRTGRVTEWNTGATNVLGWSAEQMLGHTVERIFTPEDRADSRIEVEMRGALQDGQASDKRWHMRAGGDRFWALGEMTPLYDASKQHIGFVKVFRDHTAEHIGQKALQASESRLHRAQEVGGVGLFMVDIATDILVPTPEFCRLYGLPVQPNYPASIVENQIIPDDRHLVSTRTTRSEGKAQREVEYRIRLPETGAIRWIARMGEIETDENGRAVRFVGTARDVTDQHHADDKLRGLNETLEQRVIERTDGLMQAEAQLRQSQKMEAVGQLTGGLAHDFNNLLAVITGSLELMALRISQGRSADIAKFMTAAQTAAKRASSLTHRLLAFSRRQTLDPKPIDINALVGGMQDMISRTVGPEITINLVEGQGIWTTLVDPSQLENALLNLCINARDAMPDGGRLSIETSNVKLDAAVAAIRDMPLGSYVALSVSDTGTGMAPELIARVFEPFFTTKPIGEGTGLGLSMVYGFANQSNGQVRIHSEVGRGTTVTIYLPRSEIDVEAALVVENQMPDRIERGRTVLVVDDEANVRMLVVDVLKDIGCAVLEAENGPSGLQKVLAHADIDLLITDVGMPGGMNGRQLADAARVHRPALKTLFITGYAETAVISHGRLDPGMSVLTKPFALDVLANRVKSMIEMPDQEPLPGLGA